MQLIAGGLTLVAGSVGVGEMNYGMVHSGCLS